MSIIVYGPAACGKTTNAEKLRAHFEMDRVMDDVRDPYPRSEMERQWFKIGRILFLTNLIPPAYLTDGFDRRVVSFADAMAEIDAAANKDSAE